jgi:hypothetical protein
LTEKTSAAKDHNLQRPHIFQKWTRPNRRQTLGFYLPDISLQTKWDGINFGSRAQILAYAGLPAQILSSLVFGVGSEF